MSARTRVKDVPVIGDPVHNTVLIPRKLCHENIEESELNDTTRLQGNKALRECRVIIIALFMGLAITKTQLNECEKKLEACDSQGAEEYRKAQAQQKLCDECKKDSAQPSEACRECRQKAKAEWALWQEIDKAGETANVWVKQSTTDQ